MRLMDGTDALVVTTPNLTLELCDLADGTSRAGFGRYLSREAPISACRTADGTDVVIAQLRDGRAQAWRLVDGVRVQLPGITGEPLGAAVWCDGADVVTAASDGRDLAVTLLSNGVARRYSMPGASRDSVLAGGRSSGGRPVVVMADAPGVAVWSLEEGRIERVVAAVPAGSATAACHAVIRGAEIVAVAAGNLLYVSDLAEGGPSQALVLPEPAHAVVAGPDGSLLVGFGPDLCRLAPPGLGRSAWEG
jgi:hypothetical protein